MGIGIDGAAFQVFSEGLRGGMLRPGDADYEASRRHYNLLIDKRPALIVHCAGVADVIAAVNFARSHALQVSVRGGGHNVAGRALVDDGMVIDLSRMRAVRVDPAQRTARVEGGATWADLDRESQAFGLATTGGVVSSTGIAGLTFGGGLGWLMRQYGLACDNLLSVDLVTADGRFITASAESHPELMWGVRGAGPNFGIATSLEFRLHPVGQMLAGRLTYPIEQAREVLRAFRAFVHTAPEELAAIYALGTTPDGMGVAGVFLCYNGPIAAGEEAMRSMRGFGQPIADQIQPTSYGEVQTLSDAQYPPGLCHYWKSNFLRALTDEAIDTIVGYFATVPSPLTGVLIEYLGGAVRRIPADATAFGHREFEFDLLVPSIWTDPADSDRNIRWTRDLWQAMQPFSTGGTYVNYLDEAASTRASYDGTTYARLTALKQQYDPTNFFRMNVNVPPAG